MISKEDKEYLISGSELICDKGGYESKFEVSEKSIQIQGYEVANQTDNIAGKHIKSFGSCSVMGNCKIETDLKGQFLIWFETHSKVILGDGEALLEDSYCFCPYGGKITVFDSKQVDYELVFKELFGDSAETLEQLKNNLEELQDKVVKSFITMFDGAMTEYFENEENRLREKIQFDKKYNIDNSYMYMQTMNDPKEDLAKLLRSKEIYEANKWQDIKNVNLREVYDTMNETERQRELRKEKERVGKQASFVNAFKPNALDGITPGITVPVKIAKYYINEKTRAINSVLPGIKLGELFKRGTSKEGITELYKKGVDQRNKKMLPGVFGGDVLKSANVGGYSYFSPQETMEIVDSMSDDAKAAYMLRKQANESMSAYNEVYGYYQMVKALDMSTRGKVKTGSKSTNKKSFLNEELDTTSRKIIDTKGLRNEIPLTKIQKDELKKYAKSLGFDEDKIEFLGLDNTSETSMLYDEILMINNDVLPTQNITRNPNSLISGKGTIAHEVIGHYETAKKGTAFIQGEWIAGKGMVSYPRNIALDEAQASIRAARFAPDLTYKERMILMRDGIQRLRNEDILLRDVKHLLDINER